jgi:choline monooxygenase
VPLHRWTYSGSGQAPAGTLLGAPHFAHDPCLNLNNYPLREWNGLLFEDNGRDIAADLAGMGPRAALDFPALCSTTSKCTSATTTGRPSSRSTWRTTTWARSTPGLGGFVTCDDLRWEFKARTTRCRPWAWPTAWAAAGSPVYQRWQNACWPTAMAQAPEYGAIWLTYYPHIMVEWYPHVLTVSTLHPMGPDKTMNMVEFYYPEEIAAFEREFVEAQQAAYMETCIEDDEIGERMDAGRKALLARGDNEVGPYQSPMEDGMQHFHEWYRRPHPA